MKSFIITLAIFCAVAVAGTVIYLADRQKAPPVSAPVVESPTEQTPPEKMAVPKQEQPQTVLANANETAQIPATNSDSENLKPKAATKFSKAIDALISPQTTSDQKHKLFKQLLKDGQLDQAIAELKQRAADSPNDPEIPTTLGEAQLNKLRAISVAGGDPNDLGILAMQADQNFNAALKIDPSNWEAQFVKASALSGWPVELNKGPEVIQQLSSLIDQQETMPSQPQFAQPYVVLGNEYQKTGQPDKAQATWQLGLTKFPNDPTLQQKIANPNQ